MFRAMTKIANPKTSTGVADTKVLPRLRLDVFPVGCPMIPAEYQTPVTRHELRLLVDSSLFHRREATWLIISVSDPKSCCFGD